MSERKFVDQGNNETDNIIPSSVILFKVFLSSGSISHFSAKLSIMKMKLLTCIAVSLNVVNHWGEFNFTKGFKCIIHIFHVNVKASNFVSNTRNYTRNDIQWCY